MNELKKKTPLYFVTKTHIIPSSNYRVNVGSEVSSLSPALADTQVGSRARGRPGLVSVVGREHPLYLPLGAKSLSLSTPRVIRDPPLSCFGLRDSLFLLPPVSYSVSLGCRYLRLLCYVVDVLKALAVLF